MTDDKCGSTDTTTGEPCQRPAGWGTESDIGPCKDHPTAESNRGRPSKFDDGPALRAIEAAKEGQSKGGCARSAGVTRRTLNRWLDANPTFTDLEGEQQEFRPAFMHARNIGEEKLVRWGLYGEDDDGRDIDSQHARFLLSTSFDYVKTERREHLVDDDADLAGDKPTAEFVVIGEDDDE